MPEYIGKAIAHIRDTRKMTQIELARETGIKQPNISAIESGRRPLSEDNLISIASALKITVEDIMKTANFIKKTEVAEPKPIYEDDIYRNRVNFIYRNNDVVIEIAKNILISLRVRVHDIPYEISERNNYAHGVRVPRERKPSMIESAVENVIRDMFRLHGHELAERLHEELSRSNYTIDEIINNLRKDDDIF